MTFKVETRIEIGASIYALALSSDGSQVTVTSFDQKLRAFDTAGMKALKTVHLGTSFPHVATYSPDGRWIAAGSKTLTLFDTTTWKKGVAIKGHKHEIHDATFSRDGARIYTASGDGYTPADWSVRAWDASTGAQLWRWKGPQQLRAVVASPDGRTIVAGDIRGRVTMHDATSGEQIGAAVTIPDWVDYARISPDGKHAIFGGNFDGLCAVRIADGATRVIAAGQARGAFAFTPDGARVLVGGTSDSNVSALRVFDLATGALTHEDLSLNLPMRAIEVSPDGRRVYVTRGDPDTLVVLSFD